MEIKLKEGMKFKSVYVDKAEKGDKFQVAKHDFYGKGKIWCAVTDYFIYPLAELTLSDYIPMVDGKWINEPNTYVE